MRRPKAGVSPSSADTAAAGLIPGLSGLMARHLIEAAFRAGAPAGEQQLHVSLLQRKDGTARPTGIADMLGMFAQPVGDGEQEVRGFTRTRTAFDDEGFNRLIATANRLGPAAPPQPPGRRRNPEGADRPGEAHPCGQGGNGGAHRGSGHSRR
ncbi:MAG: hypothetical protein EA384_03135 [Spirochaetaceae bacterium]|nr:MAG: hypothetical protein EA384_03135 [Spirochaetaceae bacterium]